ncbi:MAG TPA: MSMEG_4193 family putative phosphomutase [Roseiflexaceae bacterium]|nr:MSMEG_4193 family putative phosphomutase [Roseiflexaceae bacterium]
MTLLLLIRHGTNDWVHGRLAGWTPGVHLNEDGRRQATTLATRLAPIPLDAIYASPLDRTLETAQAIAHPRGMPIRIVEEIGEVKYGEWQGAELKELYKHELWPGVQFYPSGTRFPGGETLGEAQVRMVAALDTLRARHPEGIIAVVSHADIIKLAVAYYIGMHIDLFQRLEISPCSLTAIAFTRMGPRMLAYNDTGSLDHLKPKPKPAEQPAAEQAAQQTEQPAAAEQGDQPTEQTEQTEQPSAADPAGNGAAAPSPAEQPAAADGHAQSPNPADGAAATEPASQEAITHG